MSNDITRKINYENASRCTSIKKILPSHLFSKTVILPVVVYSYEHLSRTLMEENKLQMFEKKFTGKCLNLTMLK